MTCFTGTKVQILTYVCTRPDEKGLQPLHYAAGEGNMSVMRALVHTYKADMNCMDHSDTTPLHVLAQVP